MRKMTFVMTFLLFLLAVFLLSPPVQVGAYTKGAGMVATAHDFTFDVDGHNHTGYTEVGLCTFCHTPHKAYQTRLLWNHTLPPQDYTWDITNTQGGTPLTVIAGGSAGWSGPSKLCLSCHDGSVAVGDIAWFDEGPHSGAGNEVNTKKISDTAFQVGVGGDMKGNHPVAVPYPYLGATNTYHGVTTGAGVDLTDWLPSAGTGIRLFHDNGTLVSAGAVAGQTGIECSSCHDPHNGPQAIGDMFLRGNLTGNDANYICLKCHKKAG